MTSLSKLRCLLETASLQAEATHPERIGVGMTSNQRENLMETMLNLQSYERMRFVLGVLGYMARLLGDVTEVVDARNWTGRCARSLNRVLSRIMPP